MSLNKTELQIEFSNSYRTDHCGGIIDIIIDGILVGYIHKCEMEPYNKITHTSVKRCYGYVAVSLDNKSWRLTVANTQYDKMQKETYLYKPYRNQYPDMKEVRKVWEGVKIMEAQFNGNANSRSLSQEPTARKALARMKKLLIETLKEKYAS